MSIAVPVPLWSACLGLSGDPASPRRRLMRSLAAEMRVRRAGWLGAQALAVPCLVGLRAGHASWTALGGWAAAQGLIVLLLLVAGQRARRWRESEMIDILGGLLLGCGWAGAIMLTGHGGASIAPLALAGALTVAGGLLCAPVPLAALSFTIAAAAGGVVLAATRGDGALLASLPIFLAAATVNIAGQARALLRRLAAEQQMGGQMDTIALLMRDWGDDDADWLWQVDASRRLVGVDQRLAARFGRAPAEIEGQPLLALIAGEGWETGEVAAPVRVLAERLRRREAFRDLIVPVTVAGEPRWWSLSARPRDDARGTHIGYRGVASDVTERHRSVERIDRMARFDALTGLANRAHVIQALGEALAEGHRLGRRSTLMLIDLDRFKQINDTLGHPIGDRLLIEVAGRMHALTGQRDLCGRLGGDEFAVVVPDASDRDRVEALAETIVATLSAPYDIDGHRLHIGASVGSATAPRDGRAVETLLRNADLALYRAKDDGRGVHRRYEPQLHAAAERRHAIELALRAALERGELRLVYQPIVAASDGRVTGFEALLRWTHDQLGVISPDTFIPIAEEARLIGRIGDWVMHTACRDAAAWPVEVPVSINMAAAQLRDPQLPATIVSALSHSGLAPERLELEISESVLQRDGAAIGDALDRLQTLGIRLVIDGLGTGRSSAGYLRQGRFSTLKIDRSFVRGVGANLPESVAMVRSIIALAESLGMATVAEGAETRGDVERMQRLGCTRMQGWTVGAPLDPEAAHAFLVAAPRPAGTAAPAPVEADLDLPARRERHG